MALYTIGDLHLSLGGDKPMDRFGEIWQNHPQKLIEGFRDLNDDDLTVLCGDLSWAMSLAGAEEDFRFMDRLPGRKLILKGNHDYWWNSITRVRSVLPPKMQALQFNAIDAGPAVICGTRGWVFPTDEQPLDEANRKIFLRETQRLRMALEEAQELANGRPVVAMMHYPPLLEGVRKTVFTELLEEYRTHTVVYGHLHGQGIQSGFNGEQRGVRYCLVSCDSIGFSPMEIVLN